MKVDRLETHDRHQHLMKDQAVVIAQGAEDCLKRNPLSLGLQQYSPYVYLFAHARLHDNGRDTRLIWQPRLSKPKAETNSYLFRGTSNTDLVELCWFLPPREMWSQYHSGNITEAEHVLWSIEQFKNNRQALETPFPDDLSDEIGIKIIERVRADLRHDEMREKLFMPKTSEASSTPLLWTP